MWNDTRKWSWSGVTVLALLLAGGCNDGALTTWSPQNDDGPPVEETQESNDPNEANEKDEPVVETCQITNFTSGTESRFRIDGPVDCITCPGKADVVTLTYSGDGFVQELTFDGSQTNGPLAAVDELVLEQANGVCWSEGYDAALDLPTASALTDDGHASTIEFDKGPDVAGPAGTFSYVLNGELQWTLDIVEGDVAAYPDDGVPLN